MRQNAVMTWRATARAILAAAICALAATSDAALNMERLTPKRNSEVHFVRLQYQGVGFGFRGSRWLTDYPEAEYFMLPAVRRLTTLDLDDGVQIEVGDPKLFDYPWAYAVEVGYWALSDAEAANLREYMLRGGFVMVDDFHGTAEWENFYEGLHKIFPDRPVVEIPETDEIFHVLYDVERRVQIPGIAAWRSGQTYERDGTVPHWRGVYDDEGRVMMVINYNMDLGDAWEHADKPEYALTYSTLAMQYAANYFTYALTH
jgi:hypothetical protein